MRRLLSFSLALFSFSASSQDMRPRLELEPQLDLNGGGYQKVSGSISAGTGMEEKHLLWHVSGTYDAAKKAEWTPLKDNTNPHGNVRSVGAEVYGRTSGGWLFGASGGYAQLRTTNYNKHDWGLGIGLGKDFAHLTAPNANEGQSTSLRATVEYGLPIHSTKDRESGFTMRMIVPSPSETQRRVFFDTQAFVGWINGSTDASTSLGLILRF
jgi:hypothetical protein